MDSIQEALKKNWWADGDLPVRSNDSRVTWLIDGRTTLLEMCLHFLRARHTIYMANWGFTPDMLLIRGEDQSPSLIDTATYNTFVQKLQAEGLQEQDINFWLTNKLSVKNVLGYTVQKGVEVKVLLWKAKKAMAVYDPEMAYEELSTVGVTCLLDDSAEGILHHPIESLHQKMTVVDTSYAFIGGIDPLIEKEDDFDRWDTSQHLFDMPLRRNQKGETRHSWHDVHTLIEGPAAADVEQNFRQRWNDVITHHHQKKDLLIPECALPAGLESSSIVQIARTVPKHTYTFDKNAIRNINQLYTKALANTQHVVYLENQYLWLHAYYGIDLPFMGTDSAEMEEHLQQLGAALRQGAIVSIILPDHPNVGRAFTDAGLSRLRAIAERDDARARLYTFSLASSGTQDGQDDTDKNHSTRYRSIYVHAKVAIIDDLWATVGSANLNNRGMCDDTEINVALLDATLPHGLRLMLQGEHLGLVTDDELRVISRLMSNKMLTPKERKLAEQARQRLEKALGDPYQAVQLMQQRAQDNLARYKAHQPLLGHLLPYLTAEEAQQQGLNFQEEHGWIEEPYKETN